MKTNIKIIANSKILIQQQYINNTEITFWEYNK